MRVDFFGLSGDCTVHGQIELTAARLSESLGRASTIVVYGAVLRSLDEPNELLAGDQAVDFDDLFAIAATGPAGEEQRRVRTVREVLRVEAGPYVIYGEMHALPGVGGMRAFNARRGLVPMTRCQALFERSGQMELVEAPFMLINSRLVDHVEQATLEQCMEEMESRAGSLDASAAVHPGAVA
jgi:hypothetical protein